MNAMLDHSLAFFLANRLLTTRQVSFAYIDHDLRIVSVGPGLDDFTEHLTQEAVGHSLAEVFIEFFGAEQALRAVLRGQAAEFRLAPVARQTGQGDARYLSFEFLRTAHDAPAPALLLVEDITSSGILEQRLIQERNELRLTRAELRRANAELERLNEFKSTMLSMAAHDLRSPLTVMLSSIELLLDDVRHGQQRVSQSELLEVMLASTHRMSNLVSSLLDQEQARQGRLILRREACELVAVVGGVIRLLHPQAAARIELDTPAKKLELVADAERLQQVFYNLIDNALKYTPANRPVTVTIRQEGAWGVVQVADRGAGLTPEQLDQLFQMYYRTPQAQSQVVGWGLGLFIVKALVEAHGGRVEAHSEAGQGTTFSVYLPCTSE